MKYLPILLLLLISLTAQEKSGFEIKEAWIRPAATGMNTALFFKLTNNSGITDTLYDASATTADVVEVHETYSDGDKMGMRKTLAVIKPGETVEFKPRSLHVMFIKLMKDLKIGQKEKVTLHFKNSPDFTFEAEVKDNMPKEMKPKMAH